MPTALSVSIGQWSDKGRKPANQDFCDARVPSDPALLGTKGVALALADGVSSSAVSRVASEVAVKSFLADYYCTPDSWSVATSAERVIAAANSWLQAQTRRSGHATDRERGYVTTFSALVLRSRTAHLFHVGDARIWRVAGRSLEQLTEDHTVVVSSEESYLGRALGVNAHVEIDHFGVAVDAGDTFVMTTDGVHAHVRGSEMVELIETTDGGLDAAARAIVARALDAGSTDNLTVQIARVDAIPTGALGEVYGSLGDLPPAPILEPPTVFDGYRVVRTLHASSRSHVYLALDEATGAEVALKVPSVDLRDDAGYLRQFLMEEWVARRLDNPHVLKAHSRGRRPSHLYLALAYVEGQSLAQWMRDNRRPDLEPVRRIVEQLAVGLRAFHRKEMLHRDLRPHNVLVDAHGTVTIIDFGSTLVGGVAELEPVARDAIAGMLQYTAPECFLGEPATRRSDYFSLGVLVYEMLTGQLPYGADVVRADTKARQRKLRYRSARLLRPDLPAWIDGALKRALHPDPLKRYDALSAFLHDLRHPNRSLDDERPKPLMDRDPLLFWKAVSAILAVALVVVAFVRFR